MIQDLTISYVCNGIKTNLTIEDEHYDNLPYKLADMFEKVIRESDANPQIVIDNLKKKNMKIEDIEKACKLNKELKEINEILEAEFDKEGLPSSSVLMLYHNNERYNLNTLLSQNTKRTIMNFIFSNCKRRAEQIRQEIEEL